MSVQKSIYIRLYVYAYIYIYNTIIAIQNIKKNNNELFISSLNSQMFLKQKKSIDLKGRYFT